MIQKQEISPKTLPGIIKKHQITYQVLIDALPGKMHLQIKTS